MTRAVHWHENDNLLLKIQDITPNIVIDLESWLINEFVIDKRPISEKWLNY